MVKITIIKRGNKTFAIARDTKGKIISFSKQLTPKFTFENARDNFSKQNSFSEQVTKTRLTNVTEIVDSSNRRVGIRARERRRGITMYQVQAKVTIKGKTFITRSEKKQSRTKVSKAMTEARDKLIKQIAHSKGVSYEEDDITEIGEGILADNVSKIEFSIVHFTKNR